MMPLKLSWVLILSVLVLGVNTASPLGSESPSVELKSNQPSLETSATTTPSITLDDPPPGSGVSSQPEQDKPADEDQYRQAHQNNTDESLVPVGPKIRAEDTNGESQGGGDNQDDESSVTNRIVQIQIDLAHYTKLLAWFTGTLAFAAFVQVIVLIFQARYNKALTANQRVIERGYVKISHESPGLEPLDLHPHSGDNYRIQLKVENIGNTAVRLTDMNTNAVIWPANNTRLPDLPRYTTRTERFDPQFGAFLYTGDDFAIYTSLPITAQRKADVASGSQRFLVFVYIDYIDTFGIRHRAGYARSHEPNVRDGNNLTIPPISGYNYDRTRQKDEGYDWDEGAATT